MKTLFLDLASHDALIALCDETSVLASESVHARIADHELLPMIEKVCDFDDLDRLACIVGPGGFTSLRVAVTCANVLADQLGVSSAGVHLSDLYGARIETRNQKSDTTHWLHSTQKDKLFIRGTDYEDPTLISVEELSSFQFPMSNFHWCGELIDEHKAIVQSDPIDLLPISEVLPLFLATQDYQKKLLIPWYGRGW